MRLCRTCPFVLVILLSSTLWGENQWRELKTDHFSLITDASDKQSIEIATRLEQMRAVFATLMSRAKTSDPSPLHIIALRDTKELKDVLKPLGKATVHSGLFKSGADENLIVINLAENDFWHAVLHEYAHDLLNSNTNSNTETWFDEGFAEYFSTISVRHGFVEVGLVPVPDLHFLRENGKLLHLAQLFSVRPESTIYAGNGEYQSIFYAESWLLVHYLFEHGLINNIQTFFSSVEKTKDANVAVQQAFGVSVQELENRLLAYGKGESFRYFRLPCIAPRTSSWETRSLQKTEHEAMRLDVEEHFGKSADSAIAEYQRVLTDNPENELALRGVGSALLSEGNTIEASKHLRRALAVDPRDAEAHYLLALSESHALEHADSSDAQNAIREANACTSLEPNFAGCYRVLALTYASTGDSAQATLNITRAIDLSPRTESYVLDLADIKLHSGHVESAENH